MSSAGSTKLDAPLKAYEEQFAAEWEQRTQAIQEAHAQEKLEIEAARTDIDAVVNGRHKDQAYANLAVREERWAAHDEAINKYTSRSQKEEQLRQAAEAGRTDEVAALLRTGAMANARGNQGRTALHFAADRGQQDVVSLLLEFSAAPEIKADLGLTAKVMAMQKGHYAIVDLLLKHSPEIVPQPLSPSMLYRENSPCRLQLTAGALLTYQPDLDSPGIPVEVEEADAKALTLRLPDGSTRQLERRMAAYQLSQERSSQAPSSPVPLQLPDGGSVLESSPSRSHFSSPCWDRDKEHSPTGSRITTFNRRTRTYMQTDTPLAEPHFV